MGAACHCLQFHHMVNFKEEFAFVGGVTGLMVSALVSGSTGPGSSPGQGHCVVFLGKTLYSNSASPPQVYKWVPVS